MIVPQNYPLYCTVRTTLVTENENSAGTEDVRCLIVAWTLREDGDYAPILIAIDQDGWRIDMNRLPNIAEDFHGSAPVRYSE